MDINYLGHAAFRLRGKTGVVVCDPFDSDMVGLKMPQVDADIVTVSHDHGDHNAASSVKKKGDEKIVITGPGEYEIKGIDVIGVASFHDDKKGGERGKNTIFKFNIDNVSLVHLGDLGHKLAEKQVSALNGVDVLLMPVGGIYTIDARAAVGVVAQLEPRIVIPIHYKRPGMKPETFSQLSEVSEFLKEIGKESIQPQQKFSIKQGDLPEEMQVVILE